MHPDPANITSPTRRHFDLDVTPQRPGQAWRAELRSADPPSRRTFDSPFELVRFLEQLRHEDALRPGALR